MALGYEGWLKLDNPEIMCLATGTGISRSSNRIESNSGYGGRQGSSFAGSSSLGISYPRAYDFASYDGSFDIEMNIAARDLIFDKYIIEPQNSFELFYSTRNNTSITMDQNYWNGIGFQASDGEFVTCSLGLVGLTYDVADEGSANTFCDNQFGQGTFGGAVFDIAETNPLNPCSDNLNPIPFWLAPPVMTYGGNPDVSNINDKCTDWSLDLSRDVVKFFSCENIASKSVTVDPVNSDASNPSFIASGPISIAFSFTEIIGLSQVLIQNQLRPDTMDGVEILGRTFNDLELNSREDNIVSPDSLSLISYSYNVYGNIETGGNWIRPFPAV